MNTNHVPGRNNVLRILLATLPAAYLGLGAQLSQAADVPPGYEPTAKVVWFGDLNLGSPQGIERLYQRITAAAHEVCDTPSDRSLANAARSRICVRQSIEGVVAAAGIPKLTAFYAAKTGQQLKGTTTLAQR